MQLEIPQATIDILRREFPPEQICCGDVVKGDGFTPRYIQAQNIIRRLDEAFKGAWSFIVKGHEFLGTQQVVVHGSLSVRIWDGQDWVTVTKEQFGHADIRVFRNGRTDPGSDIKAAATDALKKCATLFGVAMHLYEHDEAPMQGSWRSTTGNQGQAAQTAQTPPVTQADPAQGLAQMNEDQQAHPFQIDAVTKFFQKVGIPLEYWCQNLQIAAPTGMTQKLATDVLSGQHPFIQWLITNGHIQPQSPTSLKATAA